MASDTSSRLLNLPRDILVMFPDSYLHSIEDYVNLRSSCRALRDCLSSTSSKTILKLAAASSLSCFRPYPYFLVVACARQLSAWARRSPDRVSTLKHACGRGMEGLLHLCLEHCDLTLDRIQTLHQLRSSAIDPIVRLVGKCINNWAVTDKEILQATAGPGLTAAHVEASVVLFNLIIYGELFSSSFDDFLEGRSPVLDAGVRWLFVKHCFTNWVCYDGTGNPHGISLRDPDHHRLPETREQQNRCELGQIHDLFSKDKWKAIWYQVYTRHSMQELVWWKARLLEETYLCQGLAGLNLAVSNDGATSNMDQSEKLARGLATKVAVLNRHPQVVWVGERLMYEYPSLRHDVGVGHYYYYSLFLP